MNKKLLTKYDEYEEKVTAIAEALNLRVTAKNRYHGQPNQQAAIYAAVDALYDKINRPIDGAEHNQSVLS